ncbi:hypothetical protein ACFL00_04315 [Pseudomonadota bacterium]
MSARRWGKESPANSGPPLYRFKWYRLALAIVALVVGILIIVDAMAPVSVSGAGNRLHPIGFFTSGRIQALAHFLLKPRKEKGAADSLA